MGNASHSPRATFPETMLLLQEQQFCEALHESVLKSDIDSARSVSLR
jgi:hypothetical protein